MDIYSLKKRWKFLLFIGAALIGIGSLLYTHRLVEKLSTEERKKVELWAEATKLLAQTKQTTDLNFLLKVIENNNTVPVILCDEQHKILYIRNIDSVYLSDNKYLNKELGTMRGMHAPIVIELEGGKKNYIYYNDSILIKKLTIYPYIQLIIILIFLMVSYLAFNASRKAEQNKVWLGLSRETAHQLGTPTSSLIAWIELLKERGEVNDIIGELEKDVNRLNVITERFSKIGAQPKLTSTNIVEVLEDVISYMKNRMPSSVLLHFDSNNEESIYLMLNAQLFTWVIENLIKNALDAIKNQGEIGIKLVHTQRQLFIDITDNGSGISNRNIKRIFKPGYTTKTRGWGLGLSLTKRIIENYHKGKIFVLHSEINVGTTFRIIIPIPGETK